MGFVIGRSCAFFGVLHGVLVGWFRHPTIVVLTGGYLSFFCMECSWVFVAYLFVVDLARGIGRRRVAMYPAGGNFSALHVRFVEVVQRVGYLRHLINGDGHSMVSFPWVHQEVYGFLYEELPPMVLFRCLIRDAVICSVIFGVVQQNFSWRASDGDEVDQCRWVNGVVFQVRVNPIIKWFVGVTFT